MINQQFKNDFIHGILAFKCLCGSLNLSVTIQKYFSIMEALYRCEAMIVLYVIQR
jgi:hypothetical protein